MSLKLAAYANAFRKSRSVVVETLGIPCDVNVAPFDGRDGGCEVFEGVTETVSSGFCDCEDGRIGWEDGATGNIVPLNAEEDEE